MEFPWKVKTKKFSNQLRLDIKKLETGRWVVWWYSGLLKNPKDNTTPLINVVFRSFNDGNVLSYCTIQPVPLAFLGNLPIGSVWENNICNEMIQFQTKLFSIDPLCQDCCRLN